MIELTITKRNGITLGSAITSLFDPEKMHMPTSVSGGTEFYYPDHTGEMIKLVASESYASVKTLIEAPSVNGFVKELWAYLDGSDGLAVGVHNLVDFITGEEVEIPDGAIILDGFYEVDETFTTAGADAGTIGLGVATDTMVLVTAVAVSNGGNPWDAGKHAIIPVNTPSTIVGPATADRKLTATVAVQAVTAGELRLYVRYTIDPTS